MPDVNKRIFIRFYWHSSFCGVVRAESRTGRGVESSGILFSQTILVKSSGRIMLALSNSTRDNP